MTKVKECVCKLNSGKLAMEAAMGAEISGEGGNGHFALTVARLALQPSRGGRGECGVAMGEMEAAIARRSEREATTELHGARRRCAFRRREREQVLESE